MSRTFVLIAVLLFGIPLSFPALAQGPPEQMRGKGFGGGRGPGFGMGRGMRRHAEQNEKTGAQHELKFPVIENHGGVVQLKNAAQQPRAGAKLLVDLTSGGDAGAVNPGLEKVARYVNLYAGGGAEPAELKIAVIFHGDATLSVLRPEAYSAMFKTDVNPNLQLLQALNEAGVELYVCGQSLISKGSVPEDASPFVKTAVSALTAIVNLQSDGYAYVPITTAAPATSSQTSTPETEASEENGDHNHGPFAGGGMGRGPGAMQGMQGDMTTLHAMFADRNKIKRTITNLPDGAEAITESDDVAIADMIKEHVPAMEDRVVGNKPLPPMTFHPIFVELIKHADDYTLSYEETEKGVKVKYKSNDPYVVMLVQEHAKLVSRFIKNGMEEIHTPYTLPEVPAKSNP